MCDRAAELTRALPNSDGAAGLVEEIAALSSRIAGGIPAALRSGLVEESAAGAPTSAQLRPCEICASISSALWEFERRFQYEIVVGREARRDLAERGGLCSFHTWQYESIASPQGICEGYSAFLEDWAAWMHAAAADAQPDDVVAKLRARLPSETSCPLCRVRTKAESDAITALACRFANDEAQSLSRPRLAIDSQGNVWVTDRFGNGLLGMMHMADFGIHFKLEGVEGASDYLTKIMSEQKGGRFGGSVNLLRPDGTPFPGSPFTGGSLPGPWAAAVDGNDNVWISNFAGASGQIAQLCGVRTENCPPGMKTGDQISPPGGYVGGGLQMQTDIDIDPAGDVWAMNNWQNVDSCYAHPPEALSTRCGGQGVVVFYGMAKPVRAPQIGPARGL